MSKKPKSLTLPLPKGDALYFDHVNGLVKVGKAVVSKPKNA